jgi:hypothetical protein
LSEPTNYQSLVETGKLLFQVPRRDVRKWAAYVDREVELRPGVTRVSVIREHLGALNEKAGTMTGIAGVLAAGCAVLGNLLFAQAAELDVARTIVFVILAATTLMSAIYAMSALGLEQPEDAGERGASAFEFRLLQRLVYRARNHAWGLRCSQIAATAAVVLFMDVSALLSLGE